MAPRGTVRSSRFTTVLLPKCLVSLWVAMMVSIAVGLPLRFPGTDVWFMIGPGAGLGSAVWGGSGGSPCTPTSRTAARRRPRYSDAPLAVDAIQLLLDQRPQFVGREAAGGRLAQRLADALAHLPLAELPAQFGGLGRDLHPPASPRRHDPLALQLLKGLGHGVGVDAQPHPQVA